MAIIVLHDGNNSFNLTSLTIPYLTWLNLTTLIKPMSLNLSMAFMGPPNSFRPTVSQMCLNVTKLLLTFRSANQIWQLSEIVLIFCFSFYDKVKEYIKSCWAHRVLTIQCSSKYYSQNWPIAISVHRLSKNFCNRPRFEAQSWAASYRHWKLSSLKNRT